MPDPTTPPPYSAKDFYDNELTRLNAKQQNANSILNSQERLAALNDSYRKRYAKYVQILMVLVLAYAVYLAMILAQKTFPTIPQFAVDAVIVVLIFLVAFYLFSASWELYTRSVLNYDELDISAYDASGVDVSELAEEGQVFDWQGNTSVCIGSDCCPTSYDSVTNKCNISGSTGTSPSGTPPLGTPPSGTSPSGTSPSGTSPSGTSPSGTSISSFTTLEYEKLDSAYTNVSFNSESLKRTPNAQQINPLQSVSSLIYSKF
jgi:hypothetical protein